jgi:hypothetical protein
MDNSTNGATMTDTTNQRQLTRIEWLNKRIIEVKNDLKYKVKHPEAIRDYQAYLHDLQRELALANNNICPTCKGEGVIL